jgi:hypothetical protein
MGGEADGVGANTWRREARSDAPADGWQRRCGCRKRRDGRRLMRYMPDARRRRPGGETHALLSALGAVRRGRGKSCARAVVLLAQQLVS